MTLKRLAAIVIALIGCSAIITCPAVRAEYVSVDELGATAGSTSSVRSTGGQATRGTQDLRSGNSIENLRFAALWPDTKPQPPQTPLPAVVRVIATDRNSLSLGSGTLVDANDDYGLVVTNWHVVRDAVGPVEVVFPDGFHSMARIVRADKEWDLAALLIWKPTVQPIPLSTVPPRPGEMLTIAGYGSGDYKMQSGPCVEYLAPAPGRPLEIVELAAAARHGDSGGPILNSRGELAGVLFGEGGGHTDGSYGGRVNQFLQLAAVDLRGLPASNIAKNAPARPPATIAQNNTNGIGNSSAARFAGNIGEPASSETTASAAQWPESAAPRIADRSSAGGSPQSNNRSAKQLTLAAESSNNSTANDASGWTKGPSFIWTNEIKTFLAAIGVAAIALQILRWAGS